MGALGALFAAWLTGALPAAGPVVAPPAPRPDPATATSAAAPRLPWFPGARHSRAQRDAALVRGLEYIWEAGQPDATFDEYASDLLWCFFAIGTGSTDPKLGELALGHARALARRWLGGHPKVTADTDANTVAELTTSLEISERLGFPDPRLRAALTAAVQRFGAVDFLGFDPKKTRPPHHTLALKGREACLARGIAAPLPGSGCPEVERDVPDYDVWYDALITVYFGDRFGVAHGAHRSDLLAWRADLRPYPGRAALGEDAYYDLVYLLTHFLFTSDDYGMARLDPRDWSEEIAFLRAALPVVRADHDPETWAELVEVLRAAGASLSNDRDLGDAVDELLDLQCPDGGWGNPRKDDVYGRYHSTWTAIDALRDTRASAPY